MSKPFPQEKLRSIAKQRAGFRSAFLMLFRDPAVCFLTVFSVAFVLLLKDLTFPARYQNDGSLLAVVTHFGSFLIFALLAFGWVRALRTLSLLRIDHALARCVDHACTDFRSVVGGERIRMDEAKVQVAVPIANPHRPPPTGRMLEHIFLEAKDRRFESSILVVEPFKEVWEHQLFSVQQAARYALSLGILGTFVGLIQGVELLHDRLSYLMQEQSAGALDFSALSEHFFTLVNPLFDGLKISFGTSVAGLQVSVLLGAMAMILRLRAARHCEMMEQVAVGFLSLMRNAHNEDVYLASLEKVTETLSGLESELTRHKIDIQKAVKGATQATDRQNQTLEHMVNRLEGAKHAMTEFLEQTAALQKKLQEGVVDGLQSVHDQWDRHLTDLQTQWHEVHDRGRRDMDRILKASGKHIAVGLKALREQQALTKESLTQFSENTGTQVAASLRPMAASLESVEKAHERRLKTLLDQSDKTLNDGLTQLKQRETIFFGKAQRHTEHLMKQLIDLEKEVRKEREQFVKDVSAVYDLVSMKQLGGDLKSALSTMMDSCNEQMAASGRRLETVFEGVAREVLEADSRYRGIVQEALTDRFQKLHTVQAASEAEIIKSVAQGNQGLQKNLRELEQRQSSMAQKQQQAIANVIRDHREQATPDPWRRRALKIKNWLFKHVPGR